MSFKIKKADYNVQNLKFIYFDLKKKDKLSKNIFKKK